MNIGTKTSQFAAALLAIGIFASAQALKSPFALERFAQAKPDSLRDRVLPLFLKHSDAGGNTDQAKLASGLSVIGNWQLRPPVEIDWGYSKLDAYGATKGAAFENMVALSSASFIISHPSKRIGNTLQDSDLAIQSTKSVRVTDNNRLAGEQAVADGDRLLQKWNAIFSRQAIERYKEALSIWKQINEPLEEAQILVKIGDTHLTLGELDQALESYRSARRAYRKAGDRRGESAALSKIGVIYFLYGENLKALTAAKQALEMSLSIGDRQGEAQAIRGLGDAHYGLGRLQRAIEMYQRALTIWRELKDQRGEALGLLDSGYTYSDLGEMQKAFDCYNAALSLWRVLNEKRWEGITLTALGRLHSRLGESQDALDFFQQAMEIIRPIGDQIEEARILTGMAYVYHQMGEKQEALTYLYQALALYKSVRYLEAEADALYGIGEISYALGEFLKALDFYRQVFSISQSMGDRRVELYGLAGIGKVYASLGDKKKALRCYEQVIPLYRAEKDLRAEADTLNLMGEIYAEAGEEKAMVCYKKAVSLSRNAGYRFGEASALYNIAHFEDSRNRPAQARAAIEAAIEVIESLRTRVQSEDLRISYFASVRRSYEFYIDLLMRLHQKNPSAEFNVAAFEASERGPGHCLRL